MEGVYMYFLHKCVLNLDTLVRVEVFVELYVYMLTPYHFQFFYSSLQVHVMTFW